MQHIEVLNAGYEAQDIANLQFNCKEHLNAVIDIPKLSAKEAHCVDSLVKA